MKLRSRWLFVIIAFIVLFACTSGKPIQLGGPGGTQEIKENGYTVSGPFLEMYQSADDPFIVFGFPISDVLDHPFTPGVKVQYFQRARMEYHADLPEGQQVTLANLGENFYNEVESGVDANLYTNNAACRFFKETEYPVCYTFLEFYNSHDGEKFFGMPISSVRQIEGRLVQFFERARLEWRPYELPGKRVRLTDLGQLDYYIRIGTPAQPGRESGERSLKEMQVHVFPEKPLVGPDDTQVLFVVVQDQSMKPVSGVEVGLRVYYPDRTPEYQRLKQTDDSGFTRSKEISTRGVKPNQFIKVEVEVTTGASEAPITKTTWFRVWW